MGYNEGFVGLYLSVGLASLASLRGVTSGMGWKRVGGVVLGVIGLALLAGLGRGPQILKGYVNPVNVCGIYPHIEMIGAGRLIVISVLTCGAFIVLRALSIVKIQYGMILTGALFLCVGGYDYYFHFVKGFAYLRESTMLAPHIRGLGKVERIGYDMANYHPATWCGYQFLFPMFHLEVLTAIRVSFQTQRW